LRPFFLLRNYLTQKLTLSKLPFSDNKFYSVAIAKKNVMEPNNNNNKNRKCDKKWLFFQQIRLSLKDQSAIVMHTQNIIPLSGSPIAVLGIKVKEGKSVSWLFQKISLSLTILVKSSRRDLFIDTVVQKFIFKNKLIALLSRFTSIPKTGIGLPKTGISFYCAVSGICYCIIIFRPPSIFIPRRQVSES